MNRLGADRYAPQVLIGPYRLQTRLATSKTCELWEALHERQGSTHALKVMLPSQREVYSEVRLLRREFSVARRLKHPGVIRVDDFDVQRGIGFLAMEYCPAPNLKQRIRQQGAELATLSPQIARHMAEALGYVHAQGWIHRDVKPENFLVADDGSVKLIDFSLACRQARWWNRLPGIGMRVEGTRTYMSPEQIRGGRQDQRTDIYSLGCVFYELAAGKPPFSAESSDELLTKHLRTPAPALRVANSAVSEPYAAMVRAMLAKDPRDRPASLAEVLRTLRTSAMFD